jgi:hypothetical protein
LIGFEESANCVPSLDGRRRECSLQALSRRLIGEWQNHLVVVNKTLILQTIPSLSQEGCICPHPDSFMCGHPPPAKEHHLSLEFCHLSLPDTYLWVWQWMEISQIWNCNIIVVPRTSFNKQSRHLLHFRKMLYSLFLYSPASSFTLWKSNVILPPTMKWSHPPKASHSGCLFTQFTNLNRTASLIVRLQLHRCCEASKPA